MNKVILTITLFSIATIVFAIEPIQCRPTRAECAKVRRQWGQDNGLDCNVEPQSVCDALLIQYKQNEISKYKARNGGELPRADYTDFSTSSFSIAGVNSESGFVNTKTLTLGGILVILLAGIITLRKLRK